ncbi:DUF1905 domain-containing protein [Candidatus Saccharibacteria bacterium]|nr:DUF1905 domain-containing protein [Candidatus Saccharibacteria bacterium]
MTKNNTLDGTRSVQFEAPIQAIDKWLIIQVPEEESVKLSSRGQLSVTGLLNGHEFLTVLEPDGRWSHWFKVDEKLQESLGVSAGSSVEVSLTQSSVWPEPTVPDDLAAALDAAPQNIKELWRAITPMARWEWVRWVNETRNADTRKRRVEVSISKMQSGKRRPCCFNLAACTDPDLSRSGRLMEVLPS